jgi:predicted phage terminase large subunit-like protein
LATPRKALRKLRKEVVSDLYVQIPAATRRKLETAFTDLLARTLNDANANQDLSERSRADVLKSCALAYKQMGEIMNEALEAEKRVQELLITRDEGIPEAAEIPPSLMDFIPRVSPQYEAPKHLQKYVEILESTLHRERRVVISCPPQHGKSETTIHALVWYLLNKPQSRNAYISYQSERAETMSTRTQWIADEAKLKHQGTRRYWRTKRGGDLIATGIGGGITGYGFDGLIIVDDPFKGMAEANSPTIRAHVKEWFQSVLMTRVHKGASVIVIQTRWHPDDLAGQLIDEGWDHINLEAIDNENKVLWPDKWPLDLLTRRRIEVGEFVWSALYMGHPRPRGGTVFKSPVYYDIIPEENRRYWIGVDLAYTKKNYADYSVACVLVETGGKFYVADVLREQLEPPAFRDKVNQLKVLYPNAVLAVGVSSSEQGSAYFMEDIGLELSIQKASVDKFLRAQPAAAAFNAGDILLPKDAWWLPDFKREVLSFTGIGDKHDDQVDALGSAYNAARFGSVDWSMIESLQREMPKPLELM